MLCHLGLGLHPQMADTFGLEMSTRVILALMKPEDHCSLTEKIRAQHDLGCGLAAAPWHVWLLLQAYF